MGFRIYSQCEIKNYLEYTFLSRKKDKVLTLYPFSRLRPSICDKIFSILLFLTCLEIKSGDSSRRQLIQFWRSRAANVQFLHSVCHIAVSGLVALPLSFSRHKVERILHRHDFMYRYRCEQLSLEPCSAPYH